MKQLLGRRVAVAFVVVVAIAAAGIAYASIPDANGVIHGCYNSDNGALRVFGKSKDFQQCKAGEKPLDWDSDRPDRANRLHRGDRINRRDRANRRHRANRHNGGYRTDRRDRTDLDRPADRTRTK